MDRKCIKAGIIALADRHTWMEGEITEEHSFKNDLEFDSLDDVEFVLELERKFGVEIPYEEAEKVVTIKDAIDLIEKKLS